MARITGAKCRICRRLGTKLFLKGTRCDSPKCPVEKENKPPGVHGAKRVRLTEFGIHLREVQRAKKMYGVMQRQFRRYYDEAIAKPGNTGEYLMQILERRLDNVVYRLGFGASRPESRQLVGHRHFAVNGRTVNIPSYQVKPGDVVSVREGSRKVTPIENAQALIQGRPVPEWLKLDSKAMTGTVDRLPERTEMDAFIDDQLIVEFYSR